MTSTHHRPDHLCLFCLRDASTSTGVSHIVPEALGNSAELQKEVLALPAGAVCDRCNGRRFGAKVEASFIQDDAGMLARLRGIPSKRGRHAKVSLPRNAARLEFTFLDDALSQVLAPTKADQFPVSSFRVTPSQPQTPEDAVPRAKFNLQIQLRPKHHYTSAFLSKLLVEYVAYRNSKSAALHPIFDHHRQNALNARPEEFLPYYRGAADHRPLFQLGFDAKNNIFWFTFAHITCVTPIQHPPRTQQYPEAQGFDCILPLSQSP